MTKLIPALTGRGLRVSTIKHAHHAFDIDQPGKDSWLHRQAGATEVLVASANRFALIHELRGAPEPSLAELVARLALADIVVVEGFRHGAHPKIEIFRPGWMFVAHGLKFRFSVSSADRSRGFTVPSGSPVRAAISL